MPGCDWYTRIRAHTHTHTLTAVGYVPQTMCSKARRAAESSDRVRWHVREFGTTYGPYGVPNVLQQATSSSFNHPMTRWKRITTIIMNRSVPYDSPFISIFVSYQYFAAVRFVGSTRLNGIVVHVSNWFLYTPRRRRWWQRQRIRFLNNVWLLSAAVGIVHKLIVNVCAASVFAPLNRP